MPDPSEAVTITLRIPGTWGHPRKLVESIPESCRLTADGFVLPDKSQVEFCAYDADDQFASIFRSSCRQPATPEEFAKVDHYKVNIILSGPGGSLRAARRMMVAGAAIVQAGGAGVFIDNSTLAHGGENWLAMTEDGSPDALSFAYVAIIRGKTEAWTMGMHVLGLHDIVMKPSDAAEDEFGIIDVIRYMAASEKPISDGHILMDLNGPRFKTFGHESPRERAGSPMHNPFGRLKLVSMRDLAETN
ncbi:MAG: hypothetical protein ACJ8C4_08310 [Gemmataceae bacterium]